MIAKLIWDETRSDRRLVLVAAGVLVLLSALAHFEGGRSPLDAAFVAATLLGFVLAVAVLCDLGLRVAKRTSLGGPFVVCLLLLGAYLVVLGLRDAGALLAFLGAALGVAVVLLVYARLRHG
jgi:hypothetical protein